MIFLLNIKNIFWRLLVTKHLLVPIEYHSMGKHYGGQWRNKLFGYQHNGLHKYLLLCSVETHTGLEQLEGEQMMTELSLLCELEWTQLLIWTWDSQSGKSIYYSCLSCWDCPKQSIWTAFNGRAQRQTTRSYSVHTTADLPDLTSAIKITHLDTAAST